MLFDIAWNIIFFFQESVKYLKFELNIFISYRITYFELKKSAVKIHLIYF